MSEYTDVCDYKRVRKVYSWITERNHKFVVSPDLDGMMSGVLLSHALGWELVGIYTLNDLWVLREMIPKEVSPDSPERVLEKGGFFFVDLDINRPYARSVGHHVLQWSLDTPIPFHVSGNASLNPNLVRGITNKEFNRKYPFGTFHFLLACFSAWNMIPDFQPSDDLTTLLLHIDSSFENAINYQVNALDWLRWLGGSEDGSPLYPICRRMLRLNPRTIIEQFGSLAKRFEGWGLKPRRQAAFTDPTSEAQWRSQHALLEWVRDETQWSLHNRLTPHAEYLRIHMQRESTNPTKGNFMRIMEANPFSYAIISGSDEGLNFNRFP